MAVNPRPRDRDADARDGFIDRVRAAQKKMAAAVARAGLRSDPYGEVVAALSDTLDVLAETALLSTPGISAEDIRKLNKAASANLAQETVYAVRALAVRASWRLLAICAGGLVLFGAAMFVAGGYWRPAPDIGGMTCKDEQGGRVCFVWVSPPTQQAGQQTPGKH